MLHCLRENRSLFAQDGSFEPNIEGTFRDFPTNKNEFYSREKFF
jgi:hypothetical protein